MNNQTFRQQAFISESYNNISHDIFVKMHKYDTKHHQIFTKVLKVGNIFFVIYFFCKMIQYCISVSGKSMWISGISSLFKGKLESICAEVFSVSAMTIRCQSLLCFMWRTGIYQRLIMFVEVNHGTNKGPQKEGWCCSSGKGYKAISEEFGLHKSTVRQIEHKWRKFKTAVNFLRSGRPIKITPKARHVIVGEVAKDSRVTSTQLKAFLTLANCNVHEPTIRRTLSDHGLPLAQDHVDKPEGYWRNA